jgi:hypothetical protein
VREAIKNYLTRTVEDHFMGAIVEEFKPEIKLGSFAKRQAVLKCGLDLDIPTVARNSVMRGPTDIVEREIKLGSGNYFANVSDQSSVDGEASVREFSLKHRNSTEDQGERFFNLTFRHDASEAHSYVGQLQPATTAEIYLLTLR